jgi:hypothetical protein
MNQPRWRWIVPIAVVLLLLQGSLLLAMQTAVAGLPAQGESVNAADPRLPNLWSTLIPQAELIIRGRVSHQTTRWSENQQWLETDSTISVHYALLGHVPTVIVRNEGGLLPAENLGMRASHVASFASGEEVLLFLQREGDHYRVVQEEWGKVSVLAGVALHSPLRTQRPLADLLAEIQSELVRQARPANLPADWQAREAAVEAVKIAADEDFVLTDLRWPGENPEVHFRANINTAQTGGDNGSVEAFRNAILNAGLTWGFVPGASFSLLYDGSTTATELTYNGVNEVIFFPAGDSSVAGRTRLWFNNNRTILEADFWFNSDQAWDATGDPENNEIDLESVALHEFGHWLGLGHDTNANAVMFAALSRGAVKRTLYATDIAGISFLYPCPQLPCLPPGVDPPTATATPTDTPSATPTPSPLPTDTATPVPTNTATLPSTLVPTATSIDTTPLTPTRTPPTVTSTATPIPTPTDDLSPAEPGVFLPFVSP